MDPFVASFRALARADPRAPVAIGRVPVDGREGAPAEVARVDRRAIARAADSLAAELAPRALPAGTVVALLAPSAPGFLIGYLALRSLDACVLLVDPETPPVERERVFEALGVGASLAVGPGWGTAEPAPTFELLRGGDARRLPEAAVLKLTSGSTGAPAGIAVSSRALVADHAQLEASMRLEAADRFLVVVPLSHSYGFSLLPSPACLRGSTLVFPGEQDPMRVAREERVSVLPSVPSWYRARLTLGVDDWPATTRLFLSAGAPLQPELAREWKRRCGRGIHVLYGSSECGGISYDRRGGAAERGTVGEPVDGVAIEIPAQGALEGRVLVRSESIALGYVPQPESGDDRLAQGIFRSGDLARWKGGEIELLGRADDWINVKGKKVNPREVERVLSELPGVREVAVLGVGLPDGRGQAVHAVVACEPGALTYHQVRAWCRRRLAAYKVPRGISFTTQLPRTGRGKPDRGGLQELAAGAARLPG